MANREDLYRALHASYERKRQDGKSHSEAIALVEDNDDLAECSEVAEKLGATATARAIEPTVVDVGQGMKRRCAVTSPELLPSRGFDPNRIEKFSAAAADAYGLRKLFDAWGQAQGTEASKAAFRAYNDAFDIAKARGEGAQRRGEVYALKAAVLIAGQALQQAQRQGVSHDVLTSLNAVLADAARLYDRAANPAQKVAGAPSIGRGFVRIAGAAHVAIMTGMAKLQAAETKLERLKNLTERLRKDAQAGNSGRTTSQIDTAVARSAEAAARQAEHDCETQAALVENLKAELANLKAGS